MLGRLSPSTEDRKPMSPLQSPNSAPSMDIPGGLVALQPFKGPLGSPAPLFAPTPLRRPSVGSSMMVTAFQEPPLTSFQEPPTVTLSNLSDDEHMQWTPPSNLPPNALGQDTLSYYYPLQFSPDANSLYSLNHNAFADNNNISYSGSLPASFPRSYSTEVDWSGLPTTGQNISAYPPDAYQIEPRQPFDALDMSRSPNTNLMQLSSEYETSLVTFGRDDFMGYNSSYDTDISRESTPGGGSPMVNIDDGQREQPYAQLIYRALLGAPEHTMILRDIYTWFETNTDKAQDKGTKGWQNSIRHNLSMNGAFEKVDCPGPESKKGYMWRLTESAIKEGVKSTTRYRSKQPNKRGGHRSAHHPHPQRQISGAKGGKAARLSSRLRSRRDRLLDAPYRSDAVQSHIMPTIYENRFSPESGASFTPSSYHSSPVSDVGSYEYFHTNINMGFNMNMPNLETGNFSPHSPSFVTSPHTRGYTRQEQQQEQQEQQEHSHLPLQELPYHHRHPNRYPPRRHHQEAPTSVSTSTPGPVSSPTIRGDMASLQLASDMSEPLFTNSPSPTASEPRTPESPTDGTAWQADEPVLGAGGEPLVFDGTYDESYNELI